MGDAEIDELGATPSCVLVEEDVRGLQVAVDDACRVRGVEPVAELDGERERLIHAEPPLALEAGVQVFAYEAFDDERGAAVGHLQRVQDLNDVRRADAREGLGLAEEAGERELVGGEGRVDDLDRDVAPESGVRGRVEGAHTATTELALEHVGVS